MISMETIIQQIAEKFIRNILEKADYSRMSDIDAFASELMEDCRTTAAEMLEAICSEMNLEIRKDKQGRKELGLVLKEKNRPRKLLTELGMLNLPRDYYYDRLNDRYVSVMDLVIGMRRYERIGDSISARMVNLAVDMSYARSAEVASGGAVSRQTVKNHILKAGPLEKLPDWGGGKTVRELHVFADEDHVHMQKPDKEKGKKSRIVPLVTVTEGIDRSNEGRHSTICPMHFTDVNFSTADLWESVDGYIHMAYDIDGIESIYVHGDGGRWIKSGLEGLGAVHVMDGYHLQKRLKKMDSRFPGRNVRSRMNSAIEAADRQEADRILQELYDAAADSSDTKAVEGFGKHIFGFWDEIVARESKDMTGSCTEAMISHVLSERFSRDPMGWSDKGLGALAKLRVYVKNGGRIEAKDFKQEQDQTYMGYADLMLKRATEGAVDWTIFEGEPMIFDKGSGTQVLIDMIGGTGNMAIC